MMEIIPAIDIIDGKCVRLVQGDFKQQKTYSDHPLEVAKEFEGAGIKKLHLVDLDGAREKRIINYKVLETIARSTSLSIDFGGGLHTNEDLEIAFSSGARQVTGGSIAVKNPVLFENWLTIHGSEKIILGADVKNELIAVSGWQEITEISIFDFIEGYIKKGIKYIICTDVSKDGLLKGPSTELYKRIIDKFSSISLIASGGVTTIEDLTMLKGIGAYGAIIGKAYYEGKIKLEELKRFITPE